MLTLAELSDRLQHVAEQIVERDQYVHIPILMVFHGDDEVAHIDMRDMPHPCWPQMTRLVLKIEQATSYIFICEAWRSIEGAVVKPGEQVADLPPDDRDDVLVLSVIERMHGPVRCQTAVIDNTPAGRKLRPWETADYGELFDQMPVRW